MIDLTNENHKRGIMILTSKDVRTIDKNLFDWKVNSMTIRTELRILKSEINKFNNINQNQKDEFNLSIDRIFNWLSENDVHIDRSRDVFR